MNTWCTKALTLSLTLLATFVAAQPSERASVVLNIEPLPVGEALNELARQTGLQVVLFADVSQGITTPKVEGSFSPEAALEKLLAVYGLPLSSDIQ